MKTQALRKKGFTLIELLVVISIIALLLSILFPALSRARHSARRVYCGSQVKDALVAFLSYASTAGEGKLPLGAMGKSDIREYMRGLGWSQLDYIHEYSWLPVKSFLKDTRTMICPSVPRNIKDDPEWNGEPFIPSWNLEHNWMAYWLGYNYLGGHFGEAWPEPRELDAVKWRSPYRLTDPGWLVVLCDKVSQNRRVYKSFIAHSGRGPAYGEVGESPKEFAPNGGGNQGRLDGSVIWKPVKDMEKHHAQNNFGRYDSTSVCAFW